MDERAAGARRSAEQQRETSEPDSMRLALVWRAGIAATAWCGTKVSSMGGVRARRALEESTMVASAGFICTSASAVLPAEHSSIASRIGDTVTLHPSGGPIIGLPSYRAKVSVLMSA